MSPHRRATFEGGVLRGVEQLSCGYDGGITDAPACGKPATWHVWPGSPPETREEWLAAACDDHVPTLIPKAWDWHRRAGACGMPGAAWNSGVRQGLGSCRHDLDTDTLTDALADPEGQALVQAILDRKLNR